MRSKLKVPLYLCASPGFLIVAMVATSGLAAQTRAIPAQSAVAITKSTRWRLVQVPEPATGQLRPALLQVADPSRSDPGLVGMMIRCGDKDREPALVPLFVVAEPFAPHAAPHVTLQASRQTMTVKASVVATGVALAIPIDVEAQMAGAWRKGTDLTVTIKSDDQLIKGMIDLAGLSVGLGQLAATCPKD